MGSNRKVVGTLVVFLGVQNLHRRVLGFVFGVDNDFLLVTGLFVGFFTVGNTIQDMFKIRFALEFRNNQGIVGIPRTN